MGFDYTNLAFPKPSARTPEQRSSLKRFKADPKAVESMHAWNAKKQRKPIPKVSAAKRAEMKVLAKIREEKIDQFGDVCQLKFSRDCNHRGESLHHLLKQSQGGLHTHENTLLACFTCNKAVECEPDRAAKAGLVIRRKAVA